ncbi:hypothetical protein T265_05262 [Opisthorchis viverrini]|uniref:G-protein coupled receptors family 1 profile domain-containing protein n=1 Tax=Opisthorchis viverrini TaxID=6198 RepID=A0A075AFI3_OPIVI|nr:hypothetical protein T265_05262 [Opisthorchis viverrini]KER27774.1 hypothetical protein T265_05262 [Opisthorchis viverrini]
MPDSSEKTREQLQACAKRMHVSENLDNILCDLFTVVGWSCAYILPIVCGVGFLGTLMIIIVIVRSPQQLTRQLIYLVCMLISGLFTNILIAWLRLFPTRGLPYATNGEEFFDIRYVSPASCTFFSILADLSFASYSNFLIIASLDRFMSIYFPVKMMGIHTRHAWIAAGLAALFTLLTILPTSVNTSWLTVGAKRICWFKKGHTASLVINQLFSFIIPPFAIVILNVLFYGRIRIVYSRRGKVGCNSTESQQLNASLTLFLLSTFYVIFSMPATILVFNALANLGKASKLNRQVQISRAILNLLWELFFLRELTNIVIIFFQVPVARSFARDRLITVNKYCVQLRKKMKLATGKEVNTLDGKSKEEKSMD